MYSANTDPIFLRMNDLLVMKGLKQKDLANYLGIKDGTYSNWKNGLSFSYHNYLGQICTFLNTTPNYIIWGDERCQESGETPIVKMTHEELDSFLNRMIHQMDLKQKRILAAIAQSLRTVCITNTVTD